jgi:DNA-binding NarL/FixJ family response regulator
MSERAPAPSGLKVLVVGRDPILRGGVAQYLRLTLSSVTVEEASSALEGLLIFGAAAWDLIVLDLAATRGLEPLIQLKLAIPDVPVLVLNVDPTPESVQEARTAGAAGCLNKGSPAPEWRTAVEIVARGGTYPDVASA